MADDHERMLWEAVSGNFKLASALLKLIERLEGSTVSRFIHQLSEGSEFLVKAGAEEDVGLRLAYLSQAQEILKRSCSESGGYAAHTLLEQWIPPIARYLEAHKPLLREKLPGYHDFVRQLSDGAKDVAPFVKFNGCLDLDQLQRGLKSLLNFIYEYIRRADEIDQLIVDQMAAEASARQKQAS